MITVTPTELSAIIYPLIIIADLANRIGLAIDPADFNATLHRGPEISWTRDPFDRILVAKASLEDSLLISKDPYSQHSHAT